MTRRSDFSHELDEFVRIEVSGECGYVVGRANHIEGEDQYLIRYKAADGRAVEQWWGDSAIEIYVD